MKKSFVEIALVAMTCARALAGGPRPIPTMGRGLPAPEDRGAEQAVDLEPRWDGNDIVAGSKRLSIQLNSKLALTEGGTTLFTMQYFGYAESKATGKRLWTDPTYRFREGGGRMFRDGNAIVHERPFRLEDFSWDNAFRQRVELLPDSLVMIEVAWTEPDNDLFAFHTYGAKWTIPYERAKEGGGFVVNGEDKDCPQSQRNGGDTWRAGPDGTFEFSFFEDHAARQFRISTRPGETGDSAYLFSLQWGNEFRIADKVEGRRHGYRIYLDLRRGVEAQAAEDERGGVDFRLAENLGMPQTGTRNLLVNPSFERGRVGL